MNLTRLVYYSQRNLSEDLNIQELIETSKHNNQHLNLTGMLHFNGDHFIQVIEGGRLEVSSVYHRIARDPRHSNIILLSFEGVRERMFPTWVMGLHQGMDSQTRAAFLRYFATDVVDPESVNVDGLLDVMQDLMATPPAKLAINI
ncbi:BLUF domain-containing protein [uncultured Litoreibacter sp.]|uniref:BLUF domain-containing protein n=1 Tax=uncultured Litoreibacter sp. TaxID=1392394 RepID=UPI002605CC82|nr:BLUF domain-containing protein [uncultured Litoreibacter sp.]